MSNDERQCRGLRCFPKRRDKVPGDMDIFRRFVTAQLQQIPSYPPVISCPGEKCLAARLTPSPHSFHDVELTGFPLVKPIGVPRLDPRCVTQTQE